MNNYKRNWVWDFTVRVIYTWSGVVVLARKDSLSLILVTYLTSFDPSLVLRSDHRFFSNLLLKIIGIVFYIENPRQSWVDINSNCFLYLIQKTCGDASLELLVESIFQNLSRPRPWILPNSMNNFHKSPYNIWFELSWCK